MQGYGHHVYFGMPDQLNTNRRPHKNGKMRIAILLFEEFLLHVSESMCARD